MIAALRYEWRRMRSLRSTWIMAFLSVGQAAGFTFMFLQASRSFSENYVPTGATKLNDIVMFIFLPFFPVLLSVIAAQAFGHDYRHGTIRLTLSAFPRRSEVLTARIVVAMLFMLVTTALTIAAVIGVMTLYPDVTGGLDWQSVIDVSPRLLAMIALYMLIVMGIVIITRNLALGIVLPLVWWLIIENILAAIAYLRWEWVADWLPLNNFQGWVMSAGLADPEAYSPNHSVLPMLVLAAVMVVWPSAVFLKRDA